MSLGRSLSRCRRILWIPALLLLAGPAAATVSVDPLRVRLVGDRPAVERGKPYAATLELSTRVDLDLTGFSLETDGAWEVLEWTAPRALHLAPGEARRIPFRVQAVDSEQPLWLRYEIDGEPFETLLDLSPRTIESLKPGALTRIEDAALLESLGRGMDPGALRAEPGPEPSPRNRVGLEPDGVGDLRDTVTPASSRSIRVVGFLTYRRSDGVGLGVDGAVARIYDEDTGWDELLATQTLGPDGRFDVTFNWDPCFTCDGQPDIYVEFRLENSEINVQVDGTNDTYSWQTGVWGDFGGTYLDVGVNTPSIAWQMPACHIMVNLMRAWRFLANTGRDCPKVDVQWPRNSGCPTACYVSSLGEIRVPTAREWDENTQVHEYGHHFVYNFAVNTPPAYCNGFCDDSQCGHCVWCRETDHDAFNEGFPNYLGDAVLRTYLPVYGWNPVTPRMDQENLYNCGTDNTFHDPWTTEGPLGALLVDIDDGAQDDQPGPPLGIDELSLGADEILQVVDASQPTTPLAFLNSFRATYPGYTEALWATARNNGYNIDSAPPGTVTGLTSDHPLNANWDTRPNIVWSWGRATDDASGTSGYSYIVQQGSPPGMPDQTAEIGNVTSVQTGPHPAGWYYISIRAVDRDGKWSSNYAVAGPFGIRNPDPPNLTMKVHSNWAYLAVVARHAADATMYSVQAPTALYGTGGNSYVSVDYNNSGELATTQYWVTLFVDTAARGFAYRISTPPGVYDPVLNYPIAITGGRHTVGARLDDTDAMAEPNELDNTWAHQWSWQPPTLNAGAPLYSNELSTRYAGTEWIVDGSPIYPNSHGYRLINDSWFGEIWTAMSVHSDSQADYDLFLHSWASVDPNTSFTSVSAYASAGVGATDILLWNANAFFGSVAWDVGVNNYSGGGYYPGTGYYVQKKSDVALPLPGTDSATLPPNEMVRLWRFYSPGGRMLARVQVDDPSQGAVNLTFLPPSFTLGALRGAGPTVTTDPETGEAVLDLSTVAGWSGFAVWRDVNQGNNQIAVTISLEATPCDLVMTLRPPGWAAPLVPRPAADGTPTSVPAPSLLVGDAAATWLNYVVSNQGATAVPTATQDMGLYVDGTLVQADTRSGLATGAKATINLPNPVFVRGGRHVLGAHADYGDLIHEISATNNTTAAQWVWTPAAVAFDTPIALPEPVERYAGWELMPSGSPLWFNLDGIRTPAPPAPDPQDNGWRLGVAAMPDPGADVDLKLFETAPNAVNGFDTELVGSYWGPDQMDLCLVDYRSTSLRAFDVGFLAPVVQAGASRVQVRSSKFLGSAPASPGVPLAGAGTLSARPGTLAPASQTVDYGPFTFDAGAFFDLYEVALDVGTYTIRLLPGPEAIDWGVAVYRPGQAFAGKSQTIPGGISWASPPNVEESLPIVAETAGAYAIVVWKNLPTQVDTPGSFSIQVTQQSTAVAEEHRPPVGSLSTLVRPNPFTASAQVVFTLPDSRPVDIDIFDVSGRRVRRLFQGVRPAGQQSIPWDGADHAGRPVPVGFYFVRVAAGDLVDHRKIVHTR